MTDSAEIMPAATSHEDIYNQTSGSNSLSSSFCSSTSYLPDYMMMFKDPSHHHPLLDRSSCGSLKHIDSIHNLKGELNSNNQKSSINQLTKNHHNFNNLINYQQHQNQQQKQRKHQNRLPTNNKVTYRPPHHHNYYSPYQSSADYLHSKISVCYNADDDDDVDYVYADEDYADDEVRETNHHDDILYCNAPISMKEISENQLASNQMYQETMTPHYLTIEELKSARTSCWLCGCNWQQDHVSLDCPECGGYALSRPCPSCDGQCKQMWTRNINGTHDRHKASWVGECTIAGSTTTTTTTISDKQKPHKQQQISIGCYHQVDAGDNHVGESEIMSRTTNSNNKLHAVTSSSVCSSANSSDSELECQHDQIQLGNNQKQQPSPVPDQSSTTATTTTASTSSQVKPKSQQQRQYKIEAKQHLNFGSENQT